MLVKFIFMTIFNRYQFVIIFLIFLFIFFVFQLKTKNINKIEKFDQISSIIEEINNNNANFQSIVCKESKKGFDFEIRYKSPESFLLIVEGKRGKELEIGFNESDYWFYFRKFDPKNLYFCEKQKLDKTRLKTILYPQILNDLLCLNLIDMSKFKFSYKNGTIVATEEKNGFVHVVLLDIEKKAVIEQLYYEENQLVLKVKVDSFSNYKNLNIPKNISINFYKEGIFISIEIQQINESKNFSIKMPLTTNKINLIDY